jgi:hypothetical protein
MECRYPTNLRVLGSPQSKTRRQCQIQKGAQSGGDKHQLRPALRGVSAAQRIVQLTKASGFYKRITRIRRADMPTWGKGVLSLDAIYSYVRDSVSLSLAPGRNG